MHKRMLTARKQCNAHAAYSKFRSAQELLETFGLMAAEPSDETPRELFHGVSLSCELVTDYEGFLSAYRQKTNLSPLVRGSVSRKPSLSPTSEAKANATDHEDSDVSKQIHTLRLQLERQNADLQMQLKLQDKELKLQDKEIKKLQKLLEMHNDNKQSNRSVTQEMLTPSTTRETECGPADAT